MVVTKAKIIVVSVSQGGDGVDLAGKKLEEEINAWLSKEDMRMPRRILHVTQTCVQAPAIHLSLVYTIVYELQCSQ